MNRLPPLLPEWYIHTGSVYLYIVGPGPTAMRRCSVRSMTPGTLREWDIAQKAILILNQLYRENDEAGVPEILAALVGSGYQEEVL